jgi:hypothetical protein
VSPRAGGEAAKFGERYEGRWTVAQLLRVLAGQATSLLVEDEAALAQGAEFTLRRADGGVELHQVKRQPGMAASWSPTALRDAAVLAAASLHAEAGREFHFISTIPATWLERLSDAARRGATPEAFLRVHVAGAEAGREFATLESVFGGLEETWRVLRAVHVFWPQEQQLRSVNAAVTDSSGAELFEVHPIPFTDALRRALDEDEGAPTPADPSSRTPPPHDH